MKFFSVCAIAALSATASAEFSELQYVVDAVKGYSSAAEAILRKPFKLRSDSPSSSIDYADKVQDLIWAVSSQNRRGSTKTFPVNVSGVDAESEGIWGKTTMAMDEAGVNWLSIDLESGWDIKWESRKNTVSDGMYTAISWSVVPESDSSAQKEVAILGAKRDSGDSTKATTPALEFQDLIQVTTDEGANSDFSREGMAIFGGSIDTDAATPTAWRLTKTSSSDVVYKNKKYITGMGVSAVRPFEPTRDRVSALTIKNQNSYVVCASQWVAYKNQMGASTQSCDKIEVDLPVPAPEPEPEEEKEEEEEKVAANTSDDKSSESGASILTMSAAAVIALYSMNF